MNKNDVLTAARAGAREVMERFTPEELPPSDRFHYHQGIFLSGAERLYHITKDVQYRDYIKAYVDYNIDENGYAPRCNVTEFDDLQPSVLLFDLYRDTRDYRYLRWLIETAVTIEYWPTNAKGGVWHKYRNRNQLWLDTMYMMGVLSAKLAYENLTGLGDFEYLGEKVYTQMRLIHEYMKNPKTGLYYHMWDDSKHHRFVNRENGLVEVHWGRAIGWYAAAMFVIAEMIPKNDPKRSEYISVGTDLLNALKEYQDPKTGLWFQVTDMVYDKRNWLETSCSALFTYAAAKAQKMGCGDFSDMIERGYDGVMSMTEQRQGKLYLSGICVGTGAGPLEAYFTRPTSTNDLHGIGAFLLMCCEIIDLL